MGLSNKEIAMSSSIAATLSIIPFFGVSKIMTTITGLKLKYNLPLMYTVGYLVYPFQFILFLPYLRLGERILGVKDSKLIWSEFILMVDENLFLAIKHFSTAFKFALLAWIVTAIPLIIFLNFLIKKLLDYFLNTEKRYLKKKKSDPLQNA